jgi:hypothetical protein
MSQFPRLPFAVICSPTMAWATQMAGLQRDQDAGQLALACGPVQTSNSQHHPCTVLLLLRASDGHALPTLPD